MVGNVRVHGNGGQIGSRGKFCDTVDGMAVGNADEHVLEIGEGFHAAKAASFDDGRPSLARRCRMSALRQALADYLAVRRTLGYRLARAEKLLAQFLAFVEERGEEHLTIETALAWAMAPANADPSWQSRRLSDVRRFVIHLRGIDPATQVPPADILPGRSRRATPYLYSAEEISALMAATTILRGSHRKATYRTLIGVLAATGMRVGETIGLDQCDFDVGDGVLTVRQGKFGKSRELPLHSSTVTVLGDHPARLAGRALRSARGTPLRDTLRQSAQP